MWDRLLQLLKQESTFFRIHVLCFTVIPLLFSGIFHGCNGRFHISYLDSLFLCYSAMTVTGLSTVNLSTTTAWQQVILYLLMAMGDFTTVSWIMVLVRKHYFRRKCEYIRSSNREVFSKRLSRSRTALINQISSPKSAIPLNINDASPRSAYVPNGSDVQFFSAQNEDLSPRAEKTTMESVSPEPTKNVEAVTPTDQSSFPLRRNASLAPATPTGVSHGVEFTASTTLSPTVTRRRFRSINESVTPSFAILSDSSQINRAPYPIDLGKLKHRGLGGFPGGWTVVRSIARCVFPETYRKLKRTLTVPNTKTLASHQSIQVSTHVKAAKPTSWLNFDILVVSRNSLFHTHILSDEELEEIGGVEYRALRLLSYLVAFYFVGTQLFSFLLIAPWLSSTHGYDEVFAAQPRLVQKTWFSLFQVMGSYTGGGLSLVDLGMVPFQRAYLMIFSLMFVILAGNHALPIFLRLLIWIGSKIVKKESPMYATLSFLLDHPRRCFVYLFPMHQTWFLVTCLVLFSLLEWISFLILDIGLNVTDSLPVGTRVLAGLFQGLAARASGFSIVPIANLAPAVQFLYIVMMYIAVYPVAMSIHTTNVYEEQSLGIFEAPPDDEDEEPELSGSRRERLGKYLHWHLRRQLSIDIWWLVWAVFIICIIERANLMDDTKKWFDVFRVLFELVSAFGGIGLSLGLPTDNFSFSGALKPLSKLVIIIIMVRGRHRGLPVAVDRAILLPQELVPQQAQTEKPAHETSENHDNS
ncbi:TrkH-domain-containing protein [Ramaria rubella]|nr:TrkH-domain-containing protein [Ramaria rubella]